MAGKVEKDIWGALGVLGDFIGRDIPEVKQAADHVRARVGIPNPSASEPASAPNGQTVGSTGGASETVDMKHCEVCDVHYLASFPHVCGSALPQEEKPRMVYQVFTGQGVLVKDCDTIGEAADLAVEKGGFVRPVRMT